jgi:hypothetical protein
MAKNSPAPATLDHRASGDVLPPSSAGQPRSLTVGLQALRLSGNNPLSHFESGQLVAILLTSPVQIRAGLTERWFFSTNSANGGLQKDTGQSTRKSRQAGVGRSATVGRRSLTGQDRP